MAWTAERYQKLNEASYWLTWVFLSAGAVAVGFQSVWLAAAAWLGVLGCYGLFHWSWWQYRALR